MTSVRPLVVVLVGAACTPRPVPVAPTAVPAVVTRDAGVAAADVASTPLDPAEAPARIELRALCPEPPEASLMPAVVGGTDDAARSESLRKEGFCALAWGRTMDDVAHALRALVGDASDRSFSPTSVEVALGALRRAPPSLTLRRIAVEPLPAFPHAPANGPPYADQFAPAREATANPLCARIHAASVRVADAVNRRVHGDEPRATARVDDGSDGAPDCLAAGGAVWALSWTHASLATDHDTTTLGVTGTLSLRTTPGPAPAGAFAVTESFTGYTGETVSVERVADWDGDGRPEAAVRFSTWAHEEGGSTRLALFTVHDGAVVPYAPADRFATAIGLADADRDGRMDLVLRSPWFFTDGCGMDGIQHEGPTALAHALPDGTFSATDDVARAWVFRACERLDATGDDALQPPDRAVFQVACARSSGMEPEALIAAMRADPEHVHRPRAQPPENDQEVCYPFQDLAMLAGVAPPFEVRRVAR